MAPRRKTQENDQGLFAPLRRLMGRLTTKKRRSDVGSTASHILSQRHSDRRRPRRNISRPAYSIVPFAPVPAPSPTPAGTSISQQAAGAIGPSWDILCRTFGLQEIYDRGMIDFLTPPPPIDHHVRSKTRVPFTHEIFPPFQYKYWRNLSMADYELIKPSILLASRILLEPSVMSFFRGMRKSEQVTDAASIHAEDMWLQPLYRFDVEPCSNLWQVARTYRHMRHLTDRIALEFRSDLLAKSGAYGMTSIILDPNDLEAKRYVMSPVFKSYL